MGAKGSTRWKGHKAKALVEECYRLSAAELAKAGRIPDGDKNGSLTWYGQGSSPQLTVKYSLFVVPVGRVQPTFLMLSAPYSQCLRYGQKGKRWLFTCPIKSCSRLVDSLYLIPGRTQFRCRLCLDLAYASNRKIQAKPRYDLTLTPPRHEIPAWMKIQLFNQR
jgi:hypothetical protein